MGSDTIASAIDSEDYLKWYERLMAISIGVASLIGAFYFGKFTRKHI